MPFHATNDGASIHYEVIERVLPRDTVFIHGNMSSARWWHPAADELKSQSNGSRSGSMILVEFRGCGQSSAPRSQAEVDMHLFADDFISLIRTFKSGPVDLVGHSTGGLIAALMLARAPELFDRALFLDPVGARGVKFEASMTAAFERMKVDKPLVAAVLGGTIWGLDPDDAFFNQVLLEDGFHAAQTVGDRVLRALDGFDARESLKSVRHFALVLHGEHDTLLSMKDSQEFADLMPNAKFEVFRGQGHCANVENPKKFVEVMTAFLCGP